MTAISSLEGFMNPPAAGLLRRLLADGADVFAVLRTANQAAVDELASFGLLSVAEAADGVTVVVRSEPYLDEGDEP